MGGGCLRTSVHPSFQFRFREAKHPMYALAKGVARTSGEYLLRRCLDACTIGCFLYAWKTLERKYELHHLTDRVSQTVQDFCTGVGAKARLGVKVAPTAESKSRKKSTHSLRLFIVLLAVSCLTFSLATRTFRLRIDHSTMIKSGVAPRSAPTNHDAMYEERGECL